MNLTEFRQRVNGAHRWTGAPSGAYVTLTAAEARWLLKGVEKDRAMLNAFADRDNWMVPLHPDYGYEENPEWMGDIDNPWNVAQACLAHWAESPDSGGTYYQGEYGKTGGRGG